MTSLAGVGPCHAVISRMPLLSILTRNEKDMSVSEGTNATTGTVTLTKRQLQAADSQLAKLLVKSNDAAEKIRDAVLGKIDECISNGAWRVAFDAEGKPFETLKEYLTFRLAPVSTLAAMIARPVAERLLLLEDDKGKRINSVRDVESITGVSRGILNEMNKTAKRAARPNDGTDSTNDSGEQESEQRIAAKRAVKRHAGAVEAVNDAVADMTAEELVKVALVASSLFARVAETFKVAGHGDFKTAFEAARKEQDQNVAQKKTAA